MPLRRLSRSDRRAAPPLSRQSLERLAELKAEANRVGKGDEVRLAAERTHGPDKCRGFEPRAGRGRTEPC
jgi:hypothetical protein